MSSPIENHKITIEKSPGPSVEEEIIAGLVAFNETKVGDANYRKLVVTVRDEGGEICGGLIGKINRGWLHVEILWLSESLRGKGLGTSVLATAEAEAVRCGCTDCYLDTFTFQARGFYERLGYSVFGELEKFPPGHSRFFMQKHLVDGTSQ